jgi:two-component system, cell cycle sensor histidine kinase PleC
MLRQARIIWMVCFALLLVSTPLVIKDISAIRDSIAIASSVDYWYESQLTRHLLNLKVALTDLRYEPTNERFDKARQLLDVAFSGVTNLPKEGGKQWHNDSITNMPQIAVVSQELNAIDNLFQQQDGIANVAVSGLARVDFALDKLHAMTMEIMYRRNERVGQTDRLMSAFKDKLVFYCVAVLAIIAALAYLMHAHIRSERSLQTAYNNVSELAERLRLAKDAAIEASHAKNRFLANVSHELRTPLNAVIGFADMMIQGYVGALNGKQKDYVQDILTSAQRLLALIADILDLSKAEAGKFELREDVADLTKIVRQASSDIRPAAMHAGVKLSAGLSAEPIIMKADPLRLRQVVDNILSNAVKFTEAGGIVTMSLARLDSGDVRLKVSDTGIGIAEEDIPRVFMAFQQAESHLARRHVGTGLGLPMVKSLIELHGGKVALDSRVGHGTTVTVDLPADRCLPSLYRKIA